MEGKWTKKERKIEEKRDSLEAQDSSVEDVDSFIEMEKSFERILSLERPEIEAFSNKASCK